MSLSDNFKAAVAKGRLKLTVIDDHRIQVRDSYYIDGYPVSQASTYDFLQRRVVIIGEYSGKKMMSATPFNELDRELLETLHHYMIEQGKTPQPLPETNPPGFTGFKKG